MVEKYLVTDQMTLTIGYDIENLTNPKTASRYKGEVTTDRYGLKIPKHAHKTANLDEPYFSTKQIMDTVTDIRLDHRLVQGVAGSVCQARQVSAAVVGIFKQGLSCCGFAL